MDKLWSPWRSKYIESFKPGVLKDGECLFCKVQKASADKDNYIVYRSNHSFIIMNLYPYNSGHLMIVPYQHTSELSSLNRDETLDCMNMVNLGCKILNDSVFPHGFNIGVNIGRISGAGIDEHVHFHIVPRWSGDTNFMPVINDVKLVSEGMDDTYKKLLKALEKNNL